MYAFAFLVSVAVVFILFAGIVKISTKKFSTYKKSTPTYTFLFVRNNEDCIEGVLRHLISAADKYKNINQKIIVIDINSTDNTVSIVKCFAKKHSFVYLLAHNKI